MMKNDSKVLALAALSLAMAGCNITGAMDPPPAFPTGTVVGGKGKAFEPNSPAGLPVSPDSDTRKLPNLVAMREAAGSFGTVRPDPFALTSDERIFETTQTGERIFSGSGSFSVQLTPKPQAEDLIAAPEPQPYRRLSGIVVGDSILAILEEQGRDPVIVTPGSQIPNSPWRVLSIDQDKAVLVRSGKAKPTQIVVRLETPRDGTFTGGAPTGGPPGGFPGAPGGGYPGGPGGGYPGGGPGGGRGGLDP